MTLHANYPRRRTIEDLLKRQPASVVEVTVRLWEQLALELIQIMGEGGFRPLYARSIRLCNQRYPALVSAIPYLAARSGNDRFAELRLHLAALDAEKAGEISLALFDVFFGTLYSLIGEALTNSVIHAAWPTDIFLSHAKDSQI